jgi:hypothetical protein
MTTGNDQVILTGTERAAQRDARLVGPVDPGERLTVTVEVRRSLGAASLPDLAVLGARPPRDRVRIDRGAVAASYAYIHSLYETGAFVDITRGTNQVSPAPGYSADVGWDPCSGLGRIDGTNLLNELN